MSPVIVIFNANQIVKRKWNTILCSCVPKAEYGQQQKKKRINFAFQLFFVLLFLLAQHIRTTESVYSSFGRFCVCRWMVRAKERKKEKKTKIERQKSVALLLLMPSRNCDALFVLSIHKYLHKINFCKNVHKLLNWQCILCECVRDKQNKTKKCVHNFTPISNAVERISMTLSLTNLLQSIFESFVCCYFICFCFALPFQFIHSVNRSILGFRLADRPVNTLCVYVCLCVHVQLYIVHHLANQIQWPSFSTRRKYILKFRKRIATRRLLCVHSYCYFAFCLRTSHGFEVNFIYLFFFDFVILCNVMSDCNKTTAMFNCLTKIYDPLSWRVLSNNSKSWEEE